MHARVVLGVGKGVLFRAVSSVQECPHREGFHCIYSLTHTGELFDHGLDSWGAIILPMCLVSAFGRWKISMFQDFWPCLSALGAFYVSHWEKYITGVMYLPWLYDIMQLVRECNYF